jgi:hypothetical protein
MNQHVPVAPRDVSRGIVASYAPCSIACTAGSPMNAPLASSCRLRHIREYCCESSACPDAESRPEVKIDSSPRPAGHAVAVPGSATANVKDAVQDFKSAVYRRPSPRYRQRASGFSCSHSRSVRSVSWGLRHVGEDVRLIIENGPTLPRAIGSGILRAKGNESREQTIWNTRSARDEPLSGSRIGQRPTSSRCNDIPNCPYSGAG